MCLLCAGNSKTLSFKLAADRLRGSSSTSKLFRLFHAIDLFHYQCSEQSTSQVRLPFWSLYSQQCSVSAQAKGWGMGVEGGL